MIDFSLVNVGNLRINTDNVLSASSLTAIVTKDDLNNYITKDNISDFISSSILSDYLSKVDGGQISGNISILSGNYIQTNTPLNAKIYFSNNAFLQANIDSLYGDSYVGSTVFCVIGVSSEQNQIKLSGNIDILEDIANRLTVGDLYANVSKSRALTHVFSDYSQTTLGLDTPLSDAMFSLTIDDRTASIKYHIANVDVDSGIVTLVEPLSSFGFDVFDEKDVDWFIDKFNSDDNAFYLVGFPDIGNISSKKLFGQHAEGGSVRAIGRQTHAEGRDNVADMRYSHAEGSHNIAGDMASHAEGFITEANGRYSHSEGFKTKASGHASHAEGESTVASGKNSHAGGWASRAYGDWSFAQGRYAEASSYSTVAAGAYVSAYATNTIAMGTYALADDRRAFVWNGQGDSPTSGYYSSNGDSTFNINPLSGSKGFFIGLSSFDDYLNQNVENASDYIKEHELNNYAKEDELSGYMKTIATATMSQEMYGWINASGLWAGYTPNSSIGNQHIKFITVPVSAGQTITIHACQTNKAKICFLSGDFNPIPIQGSSAPLIGNSPYDNIVPANEISSIDVPTNATMLFCCSNWRGVNVLPKISVDSIPVISPSQIGIAISNLQKSIESSSSCTSNKFNKNDKDNVNNVMLQVGIDGDYEFKDGSNVWGLTHFIPCKKDNILVASRIKPQNNSQRVVVRGIQYFDYDFNQIRAQQSSLSTGMTDFRKIPESQSVNRNTWWTQISDDNCEYVRLIYAYQDEIAHADMSSYFMVQVESSDYIPHEIVEYVPFANKIADIQQSSWNGKKILFAGDSITQPSQTGYSSTDYVNMSKGEFSNKTYVNFVCEKLNCNWVETSSTAWGGAMLALSSLDAQTSGRRSLVTNISSWQDDVDAVHVMIGTNDWNYSWPDLGQFGDSGLDKLSTFYGALDYACSAILEKYPGKPIVFSTPIKRWQNGNLSSLNDITPSKGWITNLGRWNTGAYEYKIIPVPYPNSKIEIKGSSHLSCDTWYTFLSSQVHTTGYAGVYAPTSPLSAYTPGQNRIPRETIKTFTSPPIPSYLWVTYSRNDQTSYGSDSGNAWPTYVKINDIDVTASGYKIPVGLRYDLPNYKGSTLGDFVKAIRDVCGYYGIKVIDLFNECPINPIIPSHQQNLIPDKTHPSLKGHELIARYVAGALNEIY